MLVGVQTPYDIFGQTAPLVAVALGWPQANVVVKVGVADGTARVEQEYAGGHAAAPAARAPQLVALARPEAKDHATMLDGDAEEVAAKIVAVLREQGALVS